MSIPSIIPGRTLYAASCLLAVISLGCESQSTVVGSAGATFVTRDDNGSGGADNPAATSRVAAVGGNRGESTSTRGSKASSSDGAGGGTTRRSTVSSGGTTATRSATDVGGTRATGSSNASSNTTRGGEMNTSDSTNASGTSSRAGSGGTNNRGESGGASSRGGASSTGQTSAASSRFQLTSSTLEDGGVFPPSATCESSSASSQLPPLAWSGAPMGTKSYAMVFVDRTLIGATPINTNGFHSAIWDIPATTDSLPEGLPSGSPPAGIVGLETAKQKKAPSGSAYLGPCPNFPNATHVKTDSYEFRLYALDVASLPSNMTSMTVQQIYDYLEALPPLGVAILRATSNAGATTLK